MEYYQYYNFFNYVCISATVQSFMLDFDIVDDVDVNEITTKINLTAGTQYSSSYQ